MASFLPQFQTVKNSCDRLAIAVEDVNDLWPTVKDGFEERLPFKSACLNNKTRNPVFVKNLPAEFILTTDARLRSRFPHEQSLFWFREPYATVVLVTCEDLDEFKTILKPRLKLIVQHDDREWFIVFVSKAPPNNDHAIRMVRKVYAKLEVDFSTKKRERCCKLDLHSPEANFWEELESKIIESVRHTLDRRVQFYEDEIRKLSEQRIMPLWNFTHVFILKESLAFMFEMAQLHEDSLREYDELELRYLETVNVPGKYRDFGGAEHGDDQAALMNPGNKPLTQILQDDSFREFEFRQYLFACQSKLLFKLNRSFEVASRGYLFIISFSKALSYHEAILPFCLREVWVITACLAIINGTTSKYKEDYLTSDTEKEFYRLRGDLYSLCRIKFMRLAYLIGYAMDIERSPVNSASVSMLPWPKPAVWPSVPDDSSTEVLEKEKTILQATPNVKHFGIQRKPLPLEPSPPLLREANRRRASLSAGNMSEILDGHAFSTAGSSSNLYVKMSPSPNVHAISMSRTNSSPGMESSISRPMRLSEIYVAAEHALMRTISNSELWNTLSSVKNFEQKYLELTKGAADNFHCSWWKRHGVVLDGEIAAVSFKNGNIDLAAKSYEKVCALYAGEGWQELLADVLPNLAECQKILNDQAGYLSSCVRLLSLEKNLFLTRERQAFQSEIVRLGHSEMKNPVPLDVSSLISFSGNPGPPLELCDGDPSTLNVIVWSSFPDDITLESLSLTLIDTSNVDEYVKALRSPNYTVLRPAKNNITLALPPQKPGSYVLGVLTGQIGQLRFRSHNSFKGGPVDNDDFTSYEKPTRPILKVFKQRPLVDLSATVSSALLINQPQWIGIIVKPLNYSLKGAVLHIDTGPGLKIDESCVVELENYVSVAHSTDEIRNVNASKRNKSSVVIEEYIQLNIKDGNMELPDWASEISSVIWIPVNAIGDKIASGASSVTPQPQSIVDGMRTMALKLDFGISLNQSFDRTLAVHFTEPFYVSTRVVDKCSNGVLFLQVVLHSQVKAVLTIYEAWLDLQDRFVHAEHGDGRPNPSFFPLVVSPTSRAGILFSVCFGNRCFEVESGALQPDSILNIKYGVAGDRRSGAHSRINVSSECPKDSVPLFLFQCAILLQRPVLDPFLSIGFLSLPSNGLRVGQLFTMQWRLERLKNFVENPVLPDNSVSQDEIVYEVEGNPEKWMIAGRKRGHACLSRNQGSRVMISVLCLPLVSGYVRPPQLRLPGIDDLNISRNPEGPHLVCVLPPPLSSSFCIPVPN